MRAALLSAPMLLSVAQCAIARGVRPPPNLGRMVPDPRMILVDTRAGTSSPESRDAPAPPPTGHVQVVKSAPAPKHEEKSASPPAEAPKVDAKPEPTKKDEPKKEDPKKDEPKKDEAPKQAPKAVQPQPPQGPSQPLSKQPPKKEEHTDTDEGQEAAEEALDDGPHEGGPPSSDTGNKRAKPQGRRQFAPVRGGGQPKIKPKGVGFQFLRDMFSSDADAARLSLPLVLALLSAVLL